MENNELTLEQHINELRKRLMTVTVFFVINVIIGLFIAKPLIHFLQYSEHAKALQLHASNVTDPLKIFFQALKKFFQALKNYFQALEKYFHGLDFF